MYIVLWKNKGENKWRTDGTRVRDDVAMVTKDMRDYREKKVEFLAVKLENLFK